MPKIVKIGEGYVNTNNKKGQNIHKTLMQENRHSTDKRNNRCQSKQFNDNLNADRSCIVSLLWDYLKTD